MTLTARRRGRKLRVHRHIVYAVVGTVLVVGVVKFWGPLHTARLQSRELARLQHQKEALQEEQALLAEQKNRLASDEGVEAAARREGYVKPGDRRIVFVKDKTKAPAAKKK